MSESDHGPRALEPSGAEAAPDAAEVESAGRSCLALLVLAVAILLVLCVGVAVRWAMTG